ncbi:8809_t:CDS:1, partial [Scutellospora calospora]
VAISRILTNFPVLTIPPLMLSQLEKTRLLNNNPKFAIPINFGM